MDVGRLEVGYEQSEGPASPVGNVSAKETPPMSGGGRDLHANVGRPEVVSL